jgi:radical SAM superfamily enzyme YgiQ (UPF0313 family)
MRVALINPNLVVQRSDPFTTGIIYMPVSLAYLAAALREQGIEVAVIDAFAEKPRQVRRQGRFCLYGLKPDEVVTRVPEDAAAVFVYAINATAHIATLETVAQVRRAFPGLPIVVLENTQAVTAYALAKVSGEFYAAGADFILSGEGERRATRLVRALASGPDRRELEDIDGLSSLGFSHPPTGPIEDLDELPLPAWDLFPLRNYWSIRHAHGPLGSGRYLPLLTSRGCPYPCRFCVVPATNGLAWRARSPKSVVDEIEAHVQMFGVREFHIEDLNPTISDRRVQEICGEILGRGLRVSWKIAAGTKVETIKSEETIELMARAGCRYISISPETGSERVLKAIGKPFDLAHAVRMVRKMSEVGIRSQACFVLGFPGETAEDREATRGLVRELTRVGVDEIALFIITPVPGSAIDGQFQGYTSVSELNFSPAWRRDYATLSRFRLRLYRSFLAWKLRYHPFKVLRQPVNFARRRFETKMEMAPYRALSATWLGLGAR